MYFCCVLYFYKNNELLKVPLNHEWLKVLLKVWVFYAKSCQPRLRKYVQCTTLDMYLMTQVCIIALECEDEGNDGK